MKIDRKCKFSPSRTWTGADTDIFLVVADWREKGTQEFRPPCRCRSIAPGYLSDDYSLYEAHGPWAVVHEGWMVYLCQG